MNKTVMDRTKYIHQGTVIINQDTTLTDHCMFDNLYINDGAKLYTNGYKIKIENRISVPTAYSIVYGKIKRMTEKEALQLIDVLRAHGAANLHLDLNGLGQRFKYEIGYIGMWKSVIHQASYDELADLLYLAVIEKAV